MRLARRLMRTRKLMRARTFVGRKEDVTAIKNAFLDKVY
jgi:hypothetical protein